MRSSYFLRFFSAVVVTAFVFGACHNNNPQTPESFTQTNLVGSNASFNAVRTDVAFTGAWGFDFSPFGPAFISSNNTGRSVVFGPAGDERRDPIEIPGVGELPDDGQPSGVVFNPSNAFQLSTNFSPARFLYAGTDGIISGWNEGDNAVVVVDRSATASFTGITLAQNAGADYIYVANFNEGRVQTYDGAFTEVLLPFYDAGLPDGYSPYNIQNIDGKLYVSYAQRTNSGGVEFGSGKGYVNIFNTDGTFSQRFASAGNLNAPWGMTKISTAFAGPAASAANNILIGNRGDGRINRYSASGTSSGSLLSEGVAISIAGLRELRFTADSVIAEQGKLFFTASGGGTDGLFGYIQNTTEP